MQAFVDSDLCNGCGICCIVCPEGFQMIERGQRALARVRRNPIAPDLHELCRDARDCCKPRAIIVTDDPVTS